MQDEPDIICLTEHWLRTDEITYFKLNDYSLVSSFCRSVKIRGGSSIYAKKNYKCKPLEEIKSLSSELNFECCGIKICDRNLNILCVYRSPNSEIDIFFDSFYQVLELINKNNPLASIVICGDFNIDTMSNNNNNVTKLQQILESFNLQITLKSPTRITKNTATCIDNFFINFSYLRVDIINNNLSDHTSQILMIPQEKNHEPTGKFHFKLKRHFSDINILNFISTLEKETWDEVINCLDPNEACNKFYDTFSYNFNLIFPKISTKIYTNSNNKNWITTEIKALSKYKNDIFQLMKELDNLNINKCKVEEYYRFLCNKMKTMIKKTKQNISENFINESENKTQATWKLVNKLTKNKKETDDYILKDEQNNLVSNPQLIPTIFNKYFCNITQILNLPQPNNISTIKDFQNNTIFLNPCSEHEIYETCINLKNKKSSGWDDIPVKVIKLCAHQIVKPLCHLINLMLAEGIFPDLLKLAIVKPIFKKGDSTLTSNYRPISILSCLSKVFEIIIYKRLSSFLETHKVLTPHQFGYIKNRSITQAVFKNISEILFSINNNEIVIATFLDLSKAFDSVEKNTLAYKLQHYGIRGKALELVMSYMSNRRQCVEIESYENGKITQYRSEYEKLDRGVPQGSILGPLLFVLYTNDLPNIINNSVTMFADDTSILFHAKNTNLLFDNINKTVTSLLEWYKNNSLKINIEKTQAICFNNIPINSVPLENLKSIELYPYTKFLGIYIDKNLNWKYHVESVINKISKFTYALRVLRNSVSVEILIEVFNAFVQSVIRFGIIFWGHAASVLNILKIQKRCLRIINRSSSREHCRPLFKKFKVSTVFDIYIYECSVFVKSNPDIFTQYLPDHSYNTRHKSNLTLNQTKKTQIHKGVVNNCIKIYNQLPADLKALPIAMFKKKVKQYLRQDSRYSIKEFVENF